MFWLGVVSVAATVYLCGANPITAAEDVPYDKTLVLAYVVNRHGERAPDSDELALSDKQELILNKTYIEGPEGLTLLGKQRAYQIGLYLKKRFGPKGRKLVSSIYFRDEISVRSTDKERTKMTAQVAMSALYPPTVEQQWDDGLGRWWQPVPYTVVPLSEDYLRYYSNCDKFLSLMAEAKQLSLSEEFGPYLELVPLIKQNTGQNFTENVLRFQTLFDLFRSQLGLGMDIPEWAKPYMAKFSEAARLAYRLYYRNHDMKRIGGGVLLNSFTEAADAIISGKLVPQRLRMFSAHDFNIGALMAVANVESDQTIPEYGAVFSLELYMSKKTGTYSVLPVYLPQAGESFPRHLRIKDCGNDEHCDFIRFKQITENSLLTEKQFYEMCNIKTEL